MQRKQQHTAALTRALARNVIVPMIIGGFLLVCACGGPKVSGPPPATKTESAITGVLAERFAAPQAAIDKLLDDLKKMESKPDAAKTLDMLDTFIGHCGVMVDALEELSASKEALEAAAEMIGDYMEKFDDITMAFIEKDRNFEASLQAMEDRMEEIAEHIDRVMNKLMFMVAEAGKDVETKPEPVPCIEAIKLGNQLMDNENYAGAIEKYNEAQELSGDNGTCVFNVLYKRGHAHLYLGNADKSIEDFSQLIAKFPDMSYGYNSIVFPAAYYKGDFEKSLENVNKAIELDMEDTYTYYDTRGFLSVFTGDLEQATADFNKIVQMSDMDTYASELRWNVEFFGRMISHDTASANAYAYRGTALTISGEYDKAVEDFDKAIALDPENEIAKKYREYAADKKPIVIINAADDTPAESEDGNADGKNDGESDEE